MAQPNDDVVKGMIVRGSDGTIYFVYDALVELCAVEEPDLREALIDIIDGEGREEQYGKLRYESTIRVELNAELKEKFGERLRSIVELAPKIDPGKLYRPW